MFKHWLMVSSVAAAMALTGCASDGKKDSSSSRASSASSDGGFSTSGASGQNRGGATPIGDNAAGAQGANQAVDISQRVVHFEFDSSALKAKDLEIVSNHAKYLSRNSGTRVRLEGHADERGTREYNVGLGERRANAVRDALLLRGVSARQISVVSYGEERPVSLDHNERAWAENRRVEFVY